MGGDQVDTQRSQRLAEGRGSERGARDDSLLEQDRVAPVAELDSEVRARLDGLPEDDEIGEAGAREIAGGGRLVRSDVRTTGGAVDGDLATKEGE